jgi:acetyl esterase/lipase
MTILSLPRPETPKKESDSMASKQSEAVRDHWLRMTEAARANLDQTPEEIRDRVERHWGELTAEPHGIDYLEIEVAGLPALWAIPKGSAEDRVILALHGGGFVSGSIYTHRKLFGHLAKAVGARALLTDYRQLPAHTHPAPLEDATTAYRWLLDHGVDPARIAVAGDSSGGGLAVAAMLRARELGLPAAAALMLMSPWVDMTVSNRTFETNRDTEAFFYKEVVGALASAFLGGADPTDPPASPLHADLTGLPPTYIQVGGDETMLGESLQLDENARKAGVDVRIDVFPGQQHTFQMAAGHAPESDDAIHRLADWVRPKLGLGSSRPPRPYGRTGTAPLPGRTTARTAPAPRRG